MRLGRRLVGLVLVTLGVLGLIVCLAGVAGVWVLAARLQQINEQVLRQAAQLLDQLDRRAGQAGEAVGGTRKLVDQLKTTLRDAATQSVAERMASLPEIDNLEQRLASALERADGLVQVSASTAELIEQLLATVSTVASARNGDREASSELMAAISSTRESLAAASERLADLQRRLADIRQKRDVDVNLAQLTKLSLGLVAKLDVVQTQIAAFRTRLHEMRNRLGHLQGRIRTWLLASQCLLVLLIAWGGAGQYCLVLQGWRILRTRPAAVRKSPAEARL